MGGVMGGLDIIGFINGATLAAKNQMEPARDSLRAAWFYIE